MLCIQLPAGIPDSPGCLHETSVFLLMMLLLFSFCWIFFFLGRGGGKGGVVVVGCRFVLFLLFCFFLLFVFLEGKLPTNRWQRTG